MKTWNQVELPTRATPFSAELVLSMAGQAFKWKQFRMGWLLILWFAAFLRTSELVTTERKEVVLPQHGRPQEAVLLLSDTEGTKKNLLPLDKVVIKEKLCLQALQQLCGGLQPGDAVSAKQSTIPQAFQRTAACLTARESRLYALQFTAGRCYKCL